MRLAGQMHVINRIKKNYYDLLAPLYFNARLGREIEDCNSVLDLGCGWKIQPCLKSKYSVGVDAYQASIDRAKDVGIHNKLYCIDILKAHDMFKPKSFDCVMALDVIEHFIKEDGRSLLKIMETLAVKKIIIFTNNGFLSQGEYDNNPLQTHLSGWDVEEMKAQGFKVMGINGFKGIMKEEFQIRLRPVRIWQVIRDLSNIIVYKQPKLAYQILCVKELAQ